MRILSVCAAVLIRSAAAFTPAMVGAHSKTVSIGAVEVSDDVCVDMNRRNLMNLILVGSAAVTVGALAVPYLAFFIPPGAGGDGAPSPAKDALGQDIYAKAYLNSKPAGDRSLAQGLKGDATYLIVRDDKTLESFGLNAVCTHLGCIVPWSPAANKFICPCHGSQYDPDGAIVRGPAPLPLALAHVETAEDGKVFFSSWMEDDFRTGGKGWWN